MFMQQFCGINVIAYYSSNIFVQANFSETSALIASWGFGMLNWVFAFPAVWTIDTFGRRNLLLTTFPLMAIFLLMTGFAFWIPEGNGRLAVVTLGIYLFTIAYSPGEGPVPFTVSSIQSRCDVLSAQTHMLAFSTPQRRFPCMFVMSAWAWPLRCSGSCKCFLSV